MKHLKLFESYYQDLTPYTYGRSLDKNSVNIGWLDPKHDFQKGDVDKEIIEKIKNLPEAERYKGYHFCEFCQTEDRFKKARTSVNKRITYNGVTYHFPGLLDHYIEVHNYLPPQEFLEAVKSISL